MKKFLLLSIFSIISILCSAQSPIGLWENVDDEDGKPKSHIEIYEEDGKLYGKVKNLLAGATLTHCKKCKGSKKNAAIEGMIIMWDLSPSDKGYDGGKILDPKKGKEYGCKISLESANVLNVRGYLKLSVFGRTQQWNRVL